MKDLIVLAYAIYLPIAILLTFYVANSLFKNSIVYMNDIFYGRAEIAKATNTLFKIGFYLMNIGFALFILRIAGTLTSAQETIEALSTKVGGFSIYLGVMLFFNMYLFFRGKRVAKQKRMAVEINQPNVNH
jgi:predicted PurR-regulated permease PerM